MNRSVRTVLIVDDEPHVVHIIRFKLEAAGLRVLDANNARRAFEVASRDKPDLVVTDLQMPGGNGLDLAKRLHNNPSTARIPVIMLTARGHRAPIEELREANIRSLLAKPFSPSELLRKVTDLLVASEAAATGADGTEVSAA